MIKRLQKELDEISKIPSSSFFVGPIDDQDLNNWKATIIGPEGSPYQGGLFTLLIFFPPNYPFKAPTVNFITPIYHPNIMKDGCRCCHLCLPELNYEWTPITTIIIILKKFIQLLAKSYDCNSNYNTDRIQFEALAREWTLKYAS